MERTDTQLVSGAASGDSRAFAELVRRYRGPVYGYCFSRTGSFEDARDLCRDTFVRAYGRLGQPAVTAELVAFGAGPPTAAGLPFNQGDWWTYRWAEGEERHGYRTEIHRQITHTDAGGCRALHYFFCVAG